MCSWGNPAPPPVLSCSGCSCFLDTHWVGQCLGPSATHALAHPQRRRGFPTQLSGPCPRGSGSDGLWGKCLKVAFDLAPFKNSKSSQQREVEGGRRHLAGLSLHRACGIPTAPAELALRNCCFLWAPMGMFPVGHPWNSWKEGAFSRAHSGLGLILPVIFRRVAKEGEKVVGSGKSEVRREGPTVRPQAGGGSFHLTMLSNWGGLALSDSGGAWKLENMGSAHRGRAGTDA